MKDEIYVSKKVKLGKNQSRKEIYLMYKNLKE